MLSNVYLKKMTDQGEEALILLSKTKRLHDLACGGILCPFASLSMACKNHRKLLGVHLYKPVKIAKSAFGNEGCMMCLTDLQILNRTRAR